MTPTTPDKIDLYKLHRDEYAAPKKPKLIETGPTPYLAVDGTGQPGNELFEARVGALYGMAYTLKFASKAAGRDFVVCKLEGLYELGPSDSAPATDMTWCLMIRVPDFVTADDLDATRQALRDKGKEGDFDAVRLETLDEGTCVQMLHVGPYDGERETIEQMLAFAAEQGMVPHGRHHEIYLSDPRRVPPERLRTILRQPVRHS